MSDDREKIFVAMETEAFGGDFCFLSVSGSDVLLQDPRAQSDGTVLFAEAKRTVYRNVMKNIDFRSEG